MSAQRSSARDRIAAVGLVAGPLVAAALLLALPDAYTTIDGDSAELGRSGRATLAVMGWMATWWLTEAVALEATALLPIALFPLLGAGSIDEATRPYASPLVYLFLGGFLIAFGMQRWGLDRRIALRTLRAVGTRPARLIGGFMLVTAFLSSCISNTATTAMMLPVALGIIALIEGDGPAPRERSNVPTCLLLCLAYGASIGGVATIIGSPPNGFLVQYLEDEHGRTISFVKWLSIGLPVTLVLLPLTWWLMTRVIYPVPDEEIEGGEALIARELATLGRMNRGEWITLCVFGAVIAAWVVRPLLQEAVPGLSDGGIAICGGVALFAIPVSLRNRVFALDWATAKGLPFGILILFGGGLSLAAAVGRNGVAEFLGAQAGHLDGLPTIPLVVAITAGMVFLTELTSNLATTATLVPVLAALAPSLGVDPLVLAIPVTLAASCAFMLPIATPPNAIVFGSGRITIPEMTRAGIRLNFVAIGVICALAFGLVLPLLGVR